MGEGTATTIPKGREVVGEGQGGIGIPLENSSKLGTFGKNAIGRV